MADEFLEPQGFPKGDNGVHIVLKKEDMAVEGQSLTFARVAVNDTARDSVSQQIKGAKL
jgi:hypothetical protein